MDFPSIDTSKKDVESLEERAKKVLGLARNQDIDEEKLKKVFRQKAKETHPDINPENERSIEYFKLILQAKNYLKDKEGNKKLLKNDKLVEEYLGEPIEKLEKSYEELMKAYENWRRNQFYDIENDSIWPK